MLFLGLISILVQGTVFKSVIPGFFAPNLLLVLLVYIAFYEVSAFGAVLAFLLGLEFDVHLGMLLGPWAGSFVLVFGILALLSQRIFVQSSLVVFIAVLVSCLGSNIFYLGLRYPFIPVGWEAVSTVVYEGLLTAVLSPFLFPLLRKIIPKREQGVTIRAQGARV